LAIRHRNDEAGRRAACSGTNTENHLASIEMLSQLPLRLVSIGRALRGGQIAAVAKQSASAFAKVNAGHAIEKNTGGMVHSRFVVLETELICNRKFV
jgi:hypothetical protein